MAVLKIEKIVGSLPSTLSPGTLYLIRTGSGFRMRLTDKTGAIAYAPLDESSPVRTHVGTSATINALNGPLQKLTLTENSKLTVTGLEDGGTIMIIIPETTFTLDVSDFVIGNEFSGVSSRGPTTLTLVKLDGTVYLYGSSRS